MTSQDFYATLPAVDDLWALADPAAYVSVPDDWYVLVTDVCGSTAAVQAGRYKDVNMLGASSIMAVLNALPGAEIPFIFGGDGASMVVPPWHFAAARQALLGVRQLATTAYGLDLRVGAVPVAVVNRHHPLKIAKFRQSAQYCQASFMGGGMTFATELIKQDALYRLEPAERCPEANLTGLECRWQEVPSPHDHTLSLIVTALDSAPTRGPHIYQEVVQTIGQIFGEPEAYHPVSIAGLRLALSPRQLGAEVQLRSPTASRWARWQYHLRVWAENLLGTVFMRLGLTVGGVDWGEYKPAIRAATDFQKLDDVLRMVIAGTSAQTQQLVRYLEQRSQSGHLAYGLHVSDRAVLTCLILNRQNCHFHLIDGAGGGYTLAAKDLKTQLQAKAQNWRTYSHLASYRRSRSPAQKPQEPA
ncbi:DUF3095 domain-containing protein [Halomicronema sp. CCY15110]|uniref:DUF3095 domain-containing protein n=1 Tax=Halomicronema sp. CCY15110 TaxID=2767773 RepID=UPI001950C597|nr:DUF3095 domain-containing protein [Halomicronema sp. CCY15110]